MSLSPDDFFFRALDLGVGALGGAVAAVVALRTRMAHTDWRLDGHDEKIAALQRSIDDRFGTIERRQLAQLQITAAIGRKVGVDSRVDDMLVRFLASELPEDSPSPR